MDLNVTDLVFSGTGFRSARQVPCGDASRLLLDRFSKCLSSTRVLGRTELCHWVWNARPQQHQVIRNDNHHLALFDFGHFQDSECAEMARCLKDITAISDALLNKEEALRLKGVSFHRQRLRFDFANSE